MSGAKKARTRAPRAPRRLSLLSGLFGGAVDCFVRILARCGLTPEELSLIHISEPTRPY